MLYNIAICDDESNQIEYLSALVSSWAAHSGKNVRIHSFSSGEEFLFQYEDENSYDILLLDIEMKNMDGIRLAKQIRAGNDAVQIVFITGYPDYIAEGYDVAALHYLLKPVMEAKLSEVLERAAANLRKKERTIVFHSGRDKRLIPAESIVYVEVTSHISTIYTTNDDCRTKLSISKAEDLLGEGFIRCHRSYIAGIRHISRISKNEITFLDGRAIPLARSAYHAVNQAFIEYYKGGLDEAF